MVSPSSAADSLSVALVQTSPPASDHPPHAHHSYRVYPVRWLVLLLFSILNFTNAIIWISLAPVNTIAQRYYSVSEYWINSCSIIFMALFPVGFFLSCWLIDRHSLRYAFLFGGALQAVGAWLRYISTDTSDSARDHGFVYLFLGQCMGALVQPIFTNTPARLSGLWFSVDERNLATTIAAMSNPLGIAVGQSLPSQMISDQGGMPQFMLTVAILATAVLCIAVFGLHDSPPTPPSHSAQVRHDRETVRHSLSAAQQIRSDLSALIAIHDFRCLLLGVGIGLGMFNSLTTLIEQLVKPAGYSTDDAGNCGAILIAAGLTGAAIAGPLMDKTKKYFSILRGSIILSLAAMVMLFLSIRPDHFPLLASAWGVVGFTIVPLLPVCMECSAECTFPIAEDSGVGLLLMGGNLISVGLTFALQALIDIKPKYESVLTPAAGFCCALFLCPALVLGLGLKGEMKRMAAEEEDDAILPSSGPGQVQAAHPMDGQEYRLIDAIE